MKDTFIAICLTDENFESEVLRSKHLFLVNFRTEWSGPCHIMTPVIEKLAHTFQGRVTMGELDVDINTNVPTRYGIRSVPVLLFFDGGEIVEQICGAISRKDLSEKIMLLLQEKQSIDTISGQPEYRSLQRG